MVKPSIHRLRRLGLGDAQTAPLSADEQDSRRFEVEPATVPVGETGREAGTMADIAVRTAPLSSIKSSLSVQLI